MPTLRIVELQPPRQARGFALWELGFRPFYLGASIFAALSVALWAVQFAGWLGEPWVGGPIWHAHEMLFGFALAVIVGFLFTAGRNWTQQPTPTGPVLAALAALWLAARVLVLVELGWAAAAANVLFPLAAAVALAIPFHRARSRRNYFFVALLAALSGAAALVHGSHLGLLRVPAWVGLQLGLDVVLFIVAVMAGRVVPMFTNAGVPGAAAVRLLLVERAALGSVLLLLAFDAAAIEGAPRAVLAAFAAGAHACRWWAWQPWTTRRVPLVWVLHVAYAWVPVHLLLRAAADLAWVAPSPSIHALSVGAIGGLVIGMMTRTARGHTARPLRADRADTTCYVLIAAAAVVRVFGPLLLPGQAVGAIVAAGLLWSAGFALFAVRYWPVLVRARLDGLPG